MEEKIDLFKELYRKASTYEEKRKVLLDFEPDLDAIEHKLLTDLAKDNPEFILGMKRYFNDRRMIAQYQKNLPAAKPIIEFMDILPANQKQTMATAIEINQNISLPVKAIQLSLLLGRKELAAQQLEEHIAADAEMRLDPYVAQSYGSLARKEVAQKGGEAKNKDSNRMKEISVSIAKQCWADSKEDNPPRIGTVSKWIRDELLKQGHKPPEEKIIRKWISDIAPPAAKKPGRPRQIKPV